MENLLKDYQIVYIGFVVENREKAMARLSELYDIQEWQMVEWRPSKYVYRGQEYKDPYVKIAISLPNTGTRIEVLEPQTPGLQMDVLKGGTQTINHICHVVRDFDKALQTFLDAGCELVLETEYTDEIRGFRRCHYVYDKALNSYIEIAEIPYFRNEKGARL